MSWGRLALAYGWKVGGLPSDAAEEARAAALSAARRALDLDPQNEDAHVLKVMEARPTTLIARDRGLAEIVARFPKHQAANMVRAGFLTSVGRTREAVSCAEVAAKHSNGPYTAMWWSLNLHADGQQDEADAVIDEAFDLWPRHYAIWFTRYKNLAFSNPAAAAAKMVADVSKRPTGVPERNFALCAIEAQALGSRDPADIAKAMDEHMHFSRVGAGFVMNAIGFASAVGMLDIAFKLADAFYFNRGFKVGERRYTDEQGLFLKLQDRPRWFLFLPNVTAMRADHGSLN